MLSDFGQGREEEARAIKPTFYFFLSSTAYGAIDRAGILLQDVWRFLLLASDSVSFIVMGHLASVRRSELRR